MMFSRNMRSLNTDLEPVATWVNQRLLLSKISAVQEIVFYSMIFFLSRAHLK